MKLKIVELEKDEVLFSWIYRIACANGLKFRTLYDILYGDSERIVFDLSSFSFLEAMNKIYSIRSMDKAKLYLDTSLYPLLAMAMTMERQQKFIVNVFRKDADIDRSHSVFADLKLCPECLKEAKEKGLKYGIAYRSHQVDGVSICYRHGCDLKIYRRKSEYVPDDVRLYSKYLMDDVSHEIPEDVRLVYAKSVNKLLNLALDIDFLEVKEILAQRCVVLGYKGLLDQKLISAYRNSIYLAICNVLTAADDMFNADVMSYRRLISFILFLYNGDIDGFVADIKVMKPSAFSNSLLEEFLCKKCAHSYVQNHKGVAIGIGCPDCSKDSLIFYKAFENKYCDYKYSGHKGGYVHKKCGAFIKADDFLFGRSRCNCNKENRSKIYEVMKAYPDFEVVSLDTSKRIFKLRHKICGKEFTSYYSNFFRKPFCRFCEGNITKLNFVDKVRDLVGNEYSVLGDYVDTHSSIVMKHNFCGKEFVTDPANFMRGNRCPYCSRPFNKKYLTEFVDKMTSGRYQLTAEPNDSIVEVTDTYMGLKKKLTPRLLKQELLRPTPSDIIVLSGIEENARQKLLEKQVKSGNKLSGNKTDLFYDYLLEHYSSQDLLFVDEFTHSGFDRSEIKSIVRSLVNMKKLSRVVVGVYVFASNEKDYSVDELIQNKYVSRNGRTIGRYVDYAPGEKRIESTMVSIKSYREYSFAGVKLLIKGIKEI